MAFASAALAALALAVGTPLAAPAHADGGDPAGGTDPRAHDVLISSLRQAHITYPNETSAIDAAKAVCAFMGDKHTNDEVRVAVKSANPGLTTEDAAKFVGIAEGVYCSQYLVDTGR